MARLLVMARTKTHPDPEEDRVGCVKKGDIIAVMPDGHAWGTMEGPPDFVRLDIPGLAVETARQYAHEWEYAFDLNVLQRSVAQDGYRVRIENLQRRASSGAATPPLAKVRDFLEAWNCTYVRMDPEGPVVDWRVWDGLQSEEFWEVPLDGVTLTETSYNDTTGVHGVRVTFASGVTPPRARKLVEYRGGVVISGAGGVLDFTIDGTLVREALRTRVIHARSTYKARRYSFSEADVDLALAQGGEITLTTAQGLSRIIDHAA